jgi:hypothetical protein
MAVSPSKPQGFAAGSRSPHTREVAGSNPAAPMAGARSGTGCDSDFLAGTRTGRLGRFRTVCQHALVGTCAVDQRDALLFCVNPRASLRHFLGPSRLGGVAAACLVVAIAVSFVPLGTGNPPGFYRDESGIALNAALLADSGRDEYQALLPLYFESYGDWKSAPYIYLLAGVYAVTGPSELAARVLSSMLGLAAVLILGLLGYRLSGYRSVGFLTARSRDWCSRSRSSRR